MEKDPKAQYITVPVDGTIHITRVDSVQVHLYTEDNTHITYPDPAIGKGTGKPGKAFTPLGTLTIPSWDRAEETVKFWVSVRTNDVLITFQDANSAWTGSFTADKAASGTGTFDGSGAIRWR